MLNRYNSRASPPNCTSYVFRILKSDNTRQYTYEKKHNCLKIYNDHEEGKQQNRVLI